MLIIVWNGKKCNKIKNKLFLGGIIYWNWIVSFLVLNILGIINKNNPIMLRSLISGLMLIRQFGKKNEQIIFFSSNRQKLKNFFNLMLIGGITYHTTCESFYTEHDYRFGRVWRIRTLKTRQGLILSYMMLNKSPQVYTSKKPKRNIPKK